MESFYELSHKQSKIVIGLMSGTSVDGVDAALVEIREHGLETQIELLAFNELPFSTEVRSRIFNLFQPETSGVQEICQMNFLIGEFFADAALSVIADAALKKKDIDLIGSHGQTVYHLPPRKDTQYVPSTLQLGEPAVIAHRTGIPTIADFRVADVAAGGQGAPLVPYVDFLLFRETDRTIALQNVGGISNVTLIPAGAGATKVLAADTGPGNMIIDAVTEIVTNGEHTYDSGGQLAARGQPCEPLIEKWMKHPFIQASPPKTTGREAFGMEFVRDAIEQAESMHLSDSDIIATAAEFTSQTIFDYYRRFLLPYYSCDEIVVSGGGVHNSTLMQRLKMLFNPIPIRTIDAYGIPSAAKEAIAFAVLANEAVYGNCGNLPQSTGASQSKVLGKFVPP